MNNVATRELSKLSDNLLVTTLISLSKEETKATAQMLLHLAELDRRKLYRQLGYPSLFAYCVQKLKYSESAAKRRITASRCMTKFPEVYQMFLNREVSLTTIAIFEPIITPENKDLVLSQVKGRSRTEVEWLAGRYNPRKATWDRIVPIVVSQVKHPEQKLENHLGSPRTQVSSSETVGTQLQLDERYRIEFSASKVFREKLERMKGLLQPGASLEAIFERLMDQYIERNAPEKREARRIAREQRKIKPRRRAILPPRDPHLSRRKRDQVFLRDGFRCTYVSPEGVRCSATAGLHIDHIQPRALGGPNTVENLRLLCGPHNRLAAEAEFGQEFMAQFY